MEGPDMARLLNRAFREPKQIRGVLWISYSAAGAGASPKKAGSNWTSRRDRERAPDGSRGIRNQVSGLISRTSQSSGTGISRPSADSGRLLAADCQEGPFHPVAGKGAGKRQDSLPGLPDGQNGRCFQSW